MDSTSVERVGELYVLWKATEPFLAKLLGPAADQIGGLISDPIAEWRETIAKRRAERLARIARITASQIDAAGVEPILIPDYIALPLIEKATLIDDEALQQMWGSLLATASNPKTSSDVSHLFPNMLANLSPRQARFLDVLFNASVHSIMVRIRPTPATVIASHSRLDAQGLVRVVGNSDFRWTSDEEKVFTLETLISQGIMRRDQAISRGSYAALAGKIFDEAEVATRVRLRSDQEVHMEDFYQLTVAGAQLVIACRPQSARP